MIDYIIFFFLLFIAVVCYIIYEFCRLDEQAYIDPERIKIESPIESKLYNTLLFNGYYVRTQYVVPPKRYRIDLALPHYKIAIECDGKDYHSSPISKARDRRKTAYLKKRGWTVLRFSGSMINNNMKKVIRRINEEVDKI
ncbi:very-short-patch-repair endonuclease [Bacillus oleivorans]|uniref:Very-short-patch-repair endonuclease n=1 Tax=Bacillus oleivorans TaxID=1448271 RepID=A0A285CJK9_9BACI|nr:DUF559 domain-containing protein [Bacillus oleivorans]SNX67183.1 very-short-patch-repair endonuclease [Bacillus oleivorans]